MPAVCWEAEEWDIHFAVKYRSEQMSENNKKGTYYITTAIAYASGKPHIGNTYEMILADAIVRYKRLQGYDARLQTGTDEHGQKIEDKATAAGVTPQEYVDKISTEIKRIYDLVDMSYDKFIRTTDDYHKIQVQKIFRKLYDKGDIYKGVYKGMYCKACESFFTEQQLVDGKCPDCGGEVYPAEEEAYFFKISKYADSLLKHIEDNPTFIQPESRKNEMVNNFIKPGLKDLCVSRTSFKWGIPVDFDPDHVIYVWIDALTNYITGLGYDADGNSDELYNKYWPADLHLIGKDILRFHTIYWPIMLMALDLPLPKQVFGHPWLLKNDGKMSKSKGNVIYADDIVDIFGVDAVRYFCLHEMPFENDGVISWDLMLERYDSELANTLGNLVKRTVSMANKYLGGDLKQTGVKSTTQEGLLSADGTEIDKSLIDVVTAAKGIIEDKMKDLRVADALTEVFKIFKRCNKYIDETEPWILGKDEVSKERLSEVLYNLAESITIGANLLEPFMPSTSKAIMGEFFSNPEDGVREYDSLCEFGLVKEYKVIENPNTLFMRKDFDETKKLVEEIEAKQRQAAKPEYPEVEIKPEIGIEDFGKVQIRVGEVIKCEPVTKSKKLIVSQIKIGDEVRQVVSGISEYYKPEEMLGKKVAVVTNLKPAKLCGVESQGMILAASDDKGNLSVLTLDKDIIAGSEIR